MKRFIITTFLLILLTLAVFPQSISISDFDFQNSQISIAGPDKIYIRGITADGETYSALIQSLDEEGSLWRIRELYEQEQNLAPETLVLDFVAVTPQGKNNLTFRGIIVDGESYEASFTIDETGALKANAPVRQAPMPDTIEQKLGTLRDLIIEAEKDKYEKKIASLMRESEIKSDTIDVLEEENEDLNTQVGNLEDEQTITNTRVTYLQGINQQQKTNLNALTDQVESLVNNNAGLNSEISNLQAQLEQGDNEKINSLQNQISQKESLISSLSEENEEQYDKIGELTDKTESQQDKISTLQEESSAKQDRIEEMTEEKESQAEQISELAAQKESQAGQISTLTEEKESQSGQIETLTDKNRTQSNRIVQLTQQNTDLREELTEAEEAKAEPVYYSGGDKNGARIDDFNYTRTLVQGFSQSIPQLGYWDIIGDTATQTDEDQYFAKLVLPIAQQSKPTLFTFKTRSRGYGWVGTGMHIFATDKQKLRGYGFGNSLLIWLTRDPEYYGTTDTRLQLYKSDDAVQMEMVLDAIIEEPMYEYLDIAILYEPVEEYITISVNGIEKLRYKTWFGIETGLEIALRSLGGYADFTDLKVMVAE